MRLEIVTEPNQLLHQECAPVEHFDAELAKLAADMKETMNKAPGVGLAAPQVGILTQLLVVEYAGTERGDSFPFLALANPRVTWESPEKVEMLEGCLSIPGMEGDVIRPRRVRVKGQDLQGNKVEIKASGFFARVLQHEIDHLHGILYTDKLKPGATIRPVVKETPADRE